MPLLLLRVVARALAWNAAGECYLQYEGPRATKLYRLRVSDEGIACRLLASGSGDGREAAGVIEIAHDGAAAFRPTTQEAA